MSIWQFQMLLTRRLLQWSMTSAVLGVFMMLGRSFWRGVGSQFVGWALVNAAIAYFGSEGARRRMKSNTSQPKQEANNLRVLLWVNAMLDLLYMRGGKWLALRRGSSSFTRGMGIGILLQGAFLFVFDVYHAAQVPDDMAITEESNH